MTWDKRYRMMEKGEIVKKGDEVDACADGWRDPPDWQPAVNSIGQPAPDPQYPAHRRFRRRISNVGEYRVTSAPMESRPIGAHRTPDPTDTGTPQAEMDFPAYDAAYSPPMESPMETPAPPIPPNTPVKCEHTQTEPDTGQDIVSMETHRRIGATPERELAAVEYEEGEL